MVLHRARCRDGGRASLGSRKSRRLLIGQRAENPRRRDVCDLIAVDKAKSMVGLDGDAVEYVEFRNLQDVLDGPELGL